MTNNIIPFCQNKVDHLEELQYCPFDLVPGARGRWLLWWAKEKTWIAAFPSLQVAQRFIIGGYPDDLPYNPGWDRSWVGIDVKSALRRARRMTGRMPQFEFNETSNVFDLYAPLGLGFEALARLMTYEADAFCTSKYMIEMFCPLTARCFSGEEWGLEPEIAGRMVPIITEVLLHQTYARHCHMSGSAWDDLKLKRILKKHKLRLKFNKFTAMVKELLEQQQDAVDGLWRSSRSSRRSRAK